MSKLLIRRMEPEDVPAVCAADRLCFAIPWSDYTFQAELSSTIGYYRVATLDGAVVGYIGSHMIHDEAHITTFGVHPAVQRRHIGERLLADVIREAVGQGCRRITLEVRESNLAAQNLYRKYGFLPISRRKRYYSDNDEDAIVMWIEDASRFTFRALLDQRLREVDSYE